MVVGQDEAVFIDDEACPEALLLEVLGHLIFKKAVSRKIVRGGIGICPLPLTTLTVLIFTTDGLACLAKGLKEEGAPCTNAPICATGAETGSKRVASPKPAMIQARVQPTMVHFRKDNFPNLILHWPSPALDLRLH
jgi:hypothetical protein